MSEDFRCWGVVVAAGSGKRMEAGGIPKQFRSLAGIPVFEWSLAAMLASGVVEKVVVVLPPDQVLALSQDAFGVEGGKTRAESVAAGLAAVPADVSHVLVHDAARPFVSEALVRRLVEKLQGGARGVVPVVPIVDTIRTSEGSTADRAGFVAVQTPQGFERATLVRAHEEARRAGDSEAASPTDDAQLLEAIGEEVQSVPGAPENFKITTESDWLTANALVMAGVRRPVGREVDDLRAGIGVDAHRFGAPGPLRIGGVEIEDCEGLEGHSDADVVLHAISDALLGAAALGDLGRHFPEDRVKPGMSSELILAEVLAMIGDAGFRVGNVDTTVIAARPRLAHLSEAITSKLASLLEIPADCVGFKATTTDGMGLTGSGEGIAAVATAMLVRRA
ncbi:MAG: hypothetical protein DCC49_06850 [Acidobacteria bacterium]|nr:MAG: hypothetical protein DCC49_06850 [Acidobacteriota bacterium]